MGNGVLDSVPARTVGVAPAGVVWRTAVGAVTTTVRTTPRVGVARLAAGGSGLDVSRLRGRSAVGVARTGATGAAGAMTGAAGKMRGAAGGSSNLRCAERRLGRPARSARALASGLDWPRPRPARPPAPPPRSAWRPARLAAAAAASAADSSSMRWTTMVLPSPSRYPAQATRNRMAASAYCTRCKSVSVSYQKGGGGRAPDSRPAAVLAAIEADARSLKITWRSELDQLHRGQAGRLCECARSRPRGSARPPTTASTPRRAARVGRPASTRC